MARVAFVTGGTRGIGKAIVQRLHEDGFKVAAGYSGNDEAAKAIADALDVMVVKGNVGSFDDCARAVKEVEEQLGPIDILVNNAGITRDNLMLRMKDDEWYDVIDTNLNSLFRLSKAVLKGMTKGRWGRIVSIGSVVGAMGNAGQANYAAAKAGLEGFTRALAREVGSRNITVNAVAPGFIDTDMTRELPEAQRTALLTQIPAGRLGQADEIAKVVGFLAGEGAAYVTGATIPVNGGMYMS